MDEDKKTRVVPGPRREVDVINPFTVLPHTEIKAWERRLMLMHIPPKACFIWPTEQVFRGHRNSDCML